MIILSDVNISQPIVIWSKETLNRKREKKKKKDRILLETIEFIRSFQKRLAFDTSVKMWVLSLTECLKTFTWSSTERRQT